MEMVMKKMSSKLLSDLSRRHSKLAKNVIESQEDRAGTDHFLDDDEEISDVDYYGNEEDDNYDFENRTDEEDLKEIIKKAQEAGYLDKNDDSNLEEVEEEEVRSETTSRSSTGSSEYANAKRNNSTELRIDPNYKWLLKDLNLNNDKRVIDVTDVIEMNETKRAEETAAEERQDEVEKPGKSDQVLAELTEKVKIDSSQETTSNEVSKADEEETGNTESEHDETKNDHRFINQLYERLVSKEETVIQVEKGKFEYTVDDDDDDEEDDDVGDQTTKDTDGAYKKWSQQFRSSNQNDRS